MAIVKLQPGGESATMRLHRTGVAWLAAKETERERMADVYEAIRAAHSEKVPETTIAKLAGVDRMTVRRALGKL